MSNLIMLCPFCGSSVKWCGTDNENPDDDHECHHIVCTNSDCMADFDFDIKNDYWRDGLMHEEIIQPLKDECARRFNRRPE